jgi:hypothetical protein
MLFEGNFIFNYIVSIYLIFSPLLLLVLKPKASPPIFVKGYFNHFFKIFTIVLAIVNISAFIYALIVLSQAAYPDDVFTGLYGKSGFGSHSLSIINIAVSIYYFQTRNIKRFLFFLICGILGFYGLGMVILVITVFILSIPYLLKKINLIFKGIVISGVLIWIMYMINPQNMDYIFLNFKETSKIFTNYSYKDEMKKAENYKRTFVPRYFTFVDGARQLFFSDTKVFILGTSPGTFNSRTAFYLNGDFIQNSFIQKQFHENTTYHEKYVLPILNRKLITVVPWNDGTRNQPFSSIIAIFLEYGFFIGCGFSLLFIQKIKAIKKQTKFVAYKNYIKFLTIFILLLLLVQNYMEYPEIILYFILVIKLIDIDNANDKLLKKADYQL